MATKKAPAKKAPAKKAGSNRAAAKKNQTITSAERVQKSIEIGLKLAQKSGLSSVSVNAVAVAQNVSAPLIFRCVGNRDALHTKIKAAAEKAGIVLDSGKTERKRSIKEVKAIKNKVAAKKAPDRAGSHAVSGSPKKTAKPAAKPASTLPGPVFFATKPAKKAAAKSKKPKFPTLPKPPVETTEAPLIPQATKPAV